MSPGDNSVLLEIFRQSWEHNRHMGNERLGFTTLYAVIVAGALAFLSQDSDIDQRPLLVALVFVSLFGFLVSLRLGLLISFYDRRLFDLGSELQIQKKHMGLDGPPGLAKLIKTRYVFPCFYAGGLAAFTWLSVKGSI